MKIQLSDAMAKFLLESSQYIVLHEKSQTTENLEHYFISVTKDDVRDAEVELYIKSYMENFPLKDLSDVSNRYIRNNSDSFYFMFLDTLDRTEVFFPEKEKSLKANVANKLAIRMASHPIDMPTLIETKAEQYLSQAKILSQSVGVVVKTEINRGVKNGVIFAQENLPIVKEKLVNIKNKIKKM